MKYTVDLAQEKGASTWLTALPLEEFLTPQGCLQGCPGPEIWMASLECPYQKHLWNSLHRPSRAPKAASLPSDIMRSMTWLGVGCLKCASVQWRLYWAYPATTRRRNPHWSLSNNRGWSQAGHCHKWLLGWLLWKALLRCESSTHWLPPITNNALPPLIKNMRGSRSGPMNNAWNTAPLPSLSCRSLVDAAKICYKRIASLLAEIWDQPYSNTLACKLSFALLRSSIQCIRGARSAGGRPFKQAFLPTDFVVTESTKLLQLIAILLWCICTLTSTLFQCVYLLLYKKKYCNIYMWGIPRAWNADECHEVLLG